MFGSYSRSSDDDKSATLVYTVSGWTCCLCADQTHAGNKHRQNDRPRREEEAAGRARALRQTSLGQLWASLSVFTAHDPSVHRWWWWWGGGDLAWQPRPRSLALPTYAWPVTQGHSPVRGDSLHAWTSALNAAVPAQQRVRLDKRFIPTQDWNEAVNKHWAKSAVSNSAGRTFFFPWRCHRLFLFSRHLFDGRIWYTLQFLHSKLLALMSL